MIKKSFFLAVASLLATSLYAQHNPANRHIPPSPNAAALAKFVDIPVNIHTGVPQIGIPIHSWKNEVSGLSLDISLNYHAAGVRVEEMSSDVGLSWSLNAGGAITRTMRGRPDESTRGFLNTPILPNVSTPWYTGGILTHQMPLGYAVNKTNSPVDFQTVDDIDMNGLDGSQDIFFYNFNGKSGKFFIGKNGTILVQSLDNLKITPIRPSPFRLDGFEVIDDQGKLYIFNAMETTTSNTLTLRGTWAGLDENYVNDYVSSWYLSEIKSADRQTTIRFDYDGSFQSYETGFSESKAINVSGNPLDGMPAGHTADHARSSTFTNVYALRLKKISFPDSTFVNFSYGSRADLTGGYALKQIMVSGGNDNFGYQLDHGYLSSRLQLFELHKFTGTLHESPYIFFYDERLPERSSASVDYWGYANGSGELTRIPKLTLGMAFDPFLDGVDRRPNSNAASGSLTKIIYPTGGSTVYEMECNEAYGEGSFFLADSEKESHKFVKTSANIPVGYSLTEPGTTDLHIKFTELSRLEPQPGEPVWWLEEEIDATAINIVLSNAAGTWSTTLYSGTYWDLKSAGEIVIHPLSIPALGQYHITAQMSTAYLAPVEFMIDITAVFERKLKNALVGGIRAKRITNYLDGASTIPALSKTYSYVDGNGLSTGKLAALPTNHLYHLSTQQLYDSLTLNVGRVELLYMTSESGQPLGSVKVSSVGYSKVTVQETVGNSTPNGKTVYEFSDLIHRGGSNSYPFLAGEYISWAAALPKKEQVYDASGTLLRMVENDFNLMIESKLDSNFRSLKTGLVYSANTGDVNFKQFSVLQEYPIYGNSLKQWQKETSFENGASVVSEQSFTYDLMHQTKTITKQTSDGSIRTKLYYPYDFTGLWQFNQLVAENRIASAVKTELWRLDGGVEQLLVSGEATDFATFGSALRVSSTYEVKTAGYIPMAHNSSELLPAGSYRVKETVHAYNSKGAPLTISAFEGPKSGLVWHQDGLRLKALFGNAEASEIYVADFESNGNTSPSHTGALCYDGSFTPSFVPPNGKSYILTYWNWDGNKWNLVSQAYSSPISISGMIDDVMIYPSNAVPMKSFTYFPLFGVRDILEPSQLQRFEYDGFGRMISLKDRFRNLIKTYDYHYKP